MMVLDLDEDLHRPGGDQVSVPASGDPVVVDARVAVQEGDRDLLVVAVRAGAQHQPDGVGERL